MKTDGHADKQRKEMLKDKRWVWQSCWWWWWWEDVWSVSLGQLLFRIVSRWIMYKAWVMADQMYLLASPILHCEGMCVLFLYLHCLLPVPFGLLTSEQTNGSEFNANRVEMRRAQHLSSIREENSGLSPEGKGGIRRWLPLRSDCGCLLQADIMNTLDPVPQRI